MTSSKAAYLLDVDVFVALLSENHIHHALVTDWFQTPGLQWAICPFTEAGFLRNATAPGSGHITMSEATSVLARMETQPGYHYLPVSTGWRMLCSRFSSRLYGTKQVTDAYLLGLAVEEGLLLVTMDKGVLHLAGKEFSSSVFLLR